MSEGAETPQLRLMCAVKNCGALIEPGKEIRIGDQVYCGLCGIAILKSSFPVFSLPED